MLPSAIPESSTFRQSRFLSSKFLVLTVELLLATNNYETTTGLGQCFDL